MAKVPGGHSPGVERAGSDITMLSRQITDLASLWVVSVARRFFAANERVKMGEGTSAISVGGNWPVVNVVYCVALRSKQGIEGGYNKESAKAY